MTARRGRPWGGSFEQGEAWPLRSGERALLRIELVEDEDAIYVRIYAPRDGHLVECPGCMALAGLRIMGALDEHVHRMMDEAVGSNDGEPGDHILH